MHQIGLVFLAVIVTRSSAASLQAKQGLSLGNQAVGWLVMGKSQNTNLCSQTDLGNVVASFLLPPAYRFYPNSNYLHRLTVVFLTFSPTFIILTISYEGLFYFIFCMTLLSWVRLEHAIYRHQSKGSTTSRVQPSDADWARAKPEPTSTEQTTVDTKYRALAITDIGWHCSSFSYFNPPFSVPVISPLSHRSLLTVCIG